MLNVEDLVKLAAYSNKARSALIGLAKMAAKEGESEFNESVPADGTKEKEQKGAPPQQQMAPPQQQMAPPPPPQAGGDSPESAGARAAQNFLGPEIMNAAASGDPGAQDLVARTAGQIAGSVADAAARSMKNQQQVPPQQGVPADQAAAVPIQQPEQAVANQVVPNAGA